MGTHRKSIALAVVVAAGLSLATSSFGNEGAEEAKPTSWSLSQIENENNPDQVLYLLDPQDGRPPAKVREDVALQIQNGTMDHAAVYSRYSFSAALLGAKPEAPAKPTYSGASSSAGFGSKVGGGFVPTAADAGRGGSGASKSFAPANMLGSAAGPAGAPAAPAIPAPAGSGEAKNTTGASAGPSDGNATNDGAPKAVAASGSVSREADKKKIVSNHQIVPQIKVIKGKLIEGPEADKKGKYSGDFHLSQFERTNRFSVFTSTDCPSPDMEYKVHFIDEKGKKILKVEGKIRAPGSNETAVQDVPEKAQSVQLHLDPKCRPEGTVSDHRLTVKLQ